MWVTQKRPWEKIQSRLEGCTKSRSFIPIYTYDDGNFSPRSYFWLLEICLPQSTWMLSDFNFYFSSSLWLVISEFSFDFAISGMFCTVCSVTLTRLFIADHCGGFTTWIKMFCWRKFPWCVLQWRPISQIALQKLLGLFLREILKEENEQFQWDWVSTQPMKETAAF